MIGLEAEFKIFIDDVEEVPEKIWRTPSGFIEQPLPTGGALYFDGGVIDPTGEERMLSIDQLLKYMGSWLA